MFAVFGLGFQELFIVGGVMMTVGVPVLVIVIVLSLSRKDQGDKNVQMTKLLEQAFAQASKLSPKEQDLIADWLLKKLKSENR